MRFTRAGFNVQPDAATGTAGERDVITARRCEHVYSPHVCRMARNLVAPGRQRLPNTDEMASTLHFLRPSHSLATVSRTQLSRQPAAHAPPTRLISL